MPLAATTTVPITTSAAESPQGETLQRLPFVSQQPYKNLCWAACGSMILQHYNTPNSSLTDVVATMVGPQCKENLTACDVQSLPNYVFDAYHYTSDYIDAPLKSGSIQASIHIGQPLQLYWQWRDGTHHTVLIVGWYANEPDIDLCVYDPLGHHGRQTYQAVMDAGGQGSWQGTWYNITPPSQPNVA